MELILLISAMTMASVLWFYAMISICKAVGIGKDAKFWQILFCLVLGGPIGWATLLIILVYDIVDEVHKFITKGK